MLEDYLIVFLFGLLLGLFSPLMFKRWILPKFSEWLQEKVDSWRVQSNPTKQKVCPECGSSRRHKKTCSRGGGKT